MVIKKLRYFKQQTSFTCGAACLRMVLSTFGKELSEYELATLTKSDMLFGTTCELMAKAAKELGFKPTILKHLSLDDLKKYLRKGIFPITLVNAGKYVEGEKSIHGHFTVIKSIGKDKIIVNNPDLGENKRIEPNIFIEAWNLTGNLTLIIEPKNVK